MTRENLLSQPSSHTSLLVSGQENELGFGTLWNVIPTSMPKIIRKCSRCEQDRFCSSEKFRINANKKIIDVWLIYKCIHCEFTLNLPIISRTTVSKIERNLLSRLQENDTALCWQYAFDSGFFQKGIKMDWDIDFVIQEQLLDNRIVFESLAKIQILIKSEYNLKIPIFSILRAKMQLSRSQLERLFDNKTLEVFNLNCELLNLKACLGRGCILRRSSS